MIRTPIKLTLPILITTLLLTPSVSLAAGKVKPGLTSAVSALYQREFGLRIPNPAIAPQDNYYVSTAYVNNEVFRMYVNAQGTPITPAGAPGGALSILPMKRPAGTYRVALLYIDHHNTNYPKLADTMVPQILAQRNEKYKMLADKNNFVANRLQFITTRLSIDSSLIDARNASQVKSYVQATTGSTFDIYISLDLDAQHPAGGNAAFGGDFAYVGYPGAATDFLDLTQVLAEGKSWLFFILRAAYDHEIGHIFGWEHYWGSPSNVEDIITAPVLYGWEDTDGDEIPEIIDPTPYGMTSSNITRNK